MSDVCFEEEIFSHDLEHYEDDSNDEDEGDENFFFEANATESRPQRPAPNRALFLDRDTWSKITKDAQQSWARFPDKDKDLILKYGHFREVNKKKMITTNKSDLKNPSIKTPSQPSGKRQVRIHETEEDNGSDKVELEARTHEQEFEEYEQDKGTLRVSTHMTIPKGSKAPVPTVDPNPKLDANLTIQQQKGQLMKWEPKQLAKLAQTMMENSSIPAHPANVLSSSRKANVHDVSDSKKICYEV